MGDTENTAPAGEPNGQTPEFKAPATQADLDRIIQDRVARVKASYADYDELKAKAEQAGTFQSRITELEAANGELSGKVQSFEQEKERAALVSEVAEAKGVPASALRGSTREELEAHADDIAALIKPAGPVIPGQERTPSKVGDDPLREFTRNLFNANSD